MGLGDEEEAGVGRSVMLGSARNRTLAVFVFQRAGIPAKIFSHDPRRPLSGDRV
jgi:hypothetical protein